MSKTVLKIEASHQEKKGLIRITDVINDYSESSSRAVQQYIDSFVDNGVTEVEVYINSRGGNVLQASEIVNELNRIPKVTLRIGSIAASAATYLMTKFKSKAYSNTQFMIHRPRISTQGDVQTLENDLKLLQNLTDDYRSAYAQKMQITDEEVETLFAKGDYWMTAKEAHSMKLLDEIISEETEISALDVSILEACGAPNIPDLKKNTNSKNEQEMDRNLMLSALGLPADATDEQMETRARELKEKEATAQANAQQIEAMRKSQAETLVDQAITDKKISADAKDHFVKLALNDIESAKTVIASMASPSRGSDFINPQEGNEPPKDVTANWSFDDFATKDPEALMEMMVKEPKRYQALEKAHYGK